MNAWHVTAASTYLPVSVSEIELGGRQRYTLIWAITVALVMLLASVLFGVIPFIGRIHWKAYNAVFAALAKPGQASQNACPAGMFA